MSSSFLVVLAQETTSGVVAESTTASTGTAERPTAPAQPSSFGPEFFIAIIIFMLAFIFLIQRPQKKAEEERQKALDTMAKGTPVVSAGGIHGTVSKVNKDKGTIMVQVAKGVELEFTRTSITVVKEEAKASS